jgi:hypothetical protein
MATESDLSTTSGRGGPGHFETYDADLRERLVQVAEDEAAGGVERFGSARGMLTECAIWVAVGAVAWIAILLVWR